MCGICGLVSPDMTIAPSLLEEMTNSIAHRGPDDDGFFIEDVVGLGMRRLSIIDVKGGRQPIFNENGRVVVVYNGEIYNFSELRSMLLSKGHIFKTSTDTECIVHLYEEYGLDFPRYLRGMFAISLYDLDEKRLVLVRDRMGKKPLYYASTGAKFLFGSEISPILIAAPELREVNPRMIYAFFRFGFVPEPETVYSKIFQVPAGGILINQHGKISVSRYWQLDFNDDVNLDSSRSFDDCVDELDALLEESVRIRLVSEVPLGAFLSGGPDSSLIVAYMSRLLKEPIRTFTASFEEADFDESSDALRVAKYYRTDHHVRLVSLEEMRRDFFSAITRISHHVGQPFGDPSALPTYYISRLARQDLAVILGGDGADEAFCGYNHYRALRLARSYKKVPAALRRGVVDPILETWVGFSRPGPARWRAKMWQTRLQDADLPLPEMIGNKYAAVDTGHLAGLMPALSRLFEPEQRDCSFMIPFGSSHNEFQQLQFADLTFHQLNDMLVKTDRMSMANSLETRHPYLDHKVIEFAVGLPVNMKVGYFETKSILRAVAARYLPRQNARKRKQGFSVPIAYWLRSDLWQAARDRLLSSPVMDQYLAPSYVEKILADHRSGLADHNELIWCMLSFAAWHQDFMENKHESG